MLPLLRLCISYFGIPPSFLSMHSPLLFGLPWMRAHGTVALVFFFFFFAQWPRTFPKYLPSQISLPGRLPAVLRTGLRSAHVSARARLENLPPHQALLLSPFIPLCL